MGLWFTDNVYIDMTTLRIYYDDTHTFQNISGNYNRKLIELFHDNPNKMLTKNYIKQAVWGATSGITDENLHVYIDRLRKKIKDTEKNFLRTSYGNGLILDTPEKKEEPKWISETFNSNSIIKDNIYISTRKVMDNLDGEYSLGNRMHDASRIIQVCYAGTTFLASGRIGKTYEDSWREYFRRALSNKRIDLVLANPESDQMREMINYKLRPRYSAEDVDRTNPFQYNFTYLYMIMGLIQEGFIPNADFNVYLADFSLSNAYLQCIFSDDKADKETIKVDMYIPFFSKYKITEDGTRYIPEDEWADDDRPSFIVCKKKQPDLYKHLSKNIDDILHNCNQVIKKGIYMEGWEQKFKDYSNGNFTRPFNKDEILEGLL